MKVDFRFALAICKQKYKINFKTNENEQKYFSYWCKFGLWITNRKRASQKGLLEIPSKLTSKFRFKVTT